MTGVQTCALPICYASRHPPASPGSRSAIRSAAQKSGAPLFEHPARKLVPVVPDMFVTPSWLVAATSACSIFEQRAACDPATSRHHKASSHTGEATNFFGRRAVPLILQYLAQRRQSSYCRPPKGPWKKILFQSRRRETLGPYRTDERSARIPSTPSDRQRSRGRQ